MNEITRIHIAKIPYDIEISAKKEIEGYIKALESYAKDTELLRDIEIRITELLSLRGVSANGVISADDVIAIREQLGEPKDFMSSDEEVVDNKEEEIVKRRLYRNIDNAILGGVLSGIASYFRVNPLWTRLIFIVLFFGSAGSICLAYIMLWIIIPPARTATEKLQMSGRPVTLASIRELNEDESTLAVGYGRANYVRRFISVFVGLVCLFFSIVTVIFTAFAALSVIRFNVFGGLQTDMSWMYISAYVLAILAGLLLATLFAVCSYVSFSHKHSKKLLISIAVIVVLGLASFGTAIGLVTYQSSNVGNILQQNINDKAINLPLAFANSKSLVVDADQMKINYIVSDSYGITLKSLTSSKEPVISMNGSELSISLKAEGLNQWVQYNPILTIYGPKLDKIDAKSGEVTYSAETQDLSVEATGQNSIVNLSNGVYKNLSILASDQSSVDVSIVTVETVVIDSKLGSQITMGTVNTLTVVQSEACPAYTVASVHVQGISSGVMNYNGNKINAETQNTNCGSVVIGEVNN